MKMNNLLAYSKGFIRRNSSTILTCVGGAGVVVTSVLAVKATPKAILLLEKAEEEKGEELTKFEKVCVAGPSYIPSMVVGVSTVACIFGANALSKRQQASLMSAYAFLDSSYKEHKNKVKELFGDDANDQVSEEIAKDKYAEKPINAANNKLLYYDEYSKRFFESTPAEVQRAEYELNRMIVMQDAAYLNEWYSLLGLDPVDGGYSLGWAADVCSDCYWQPWVDFAHGRITMDDGTECISIVMLCEPIMDFENYFEV